MSDLIRIIDLEVEAHIGVPDTERAHAQKLLISLELGVDCFPQAAATDDVALTVNYYDVARRIKSLVARHPRKLLETLAEEIAADLLNAFPIQKLNLEIKKFVLADTRYISVQIERTIKAQSPHRAEEGRP